MSPLAPACPDGTPPRRRWRRGSNSASTGPDTRRNARSAVAVVALALLAGCTNPLGGSGASAPAATAAAAAPTTVAAGPDAWFDQVCSAGITVVTPAVAMPSVRGNRDTPAVKQAILDYMDSVLAGIRQGRAELDAAGPSPVAGGDAAVARGRSLLDEMERSIADGRAQIAAADPANPRAFALTVGRVHRQVASTVDPAAVREILATPGLAEGAARSPQCAQLQALAAAAPR